MNFPNGTLTSDGYIDHQRALDDIVFKDSKISDTGCGVIAIYNAMHYLKMNPNFNDIKNYVAKTSITTKLGTTFMHVIGYLRKKKIYGGICTCKKNFSKINLGILLYLHKQGFHWVTFYRDGDKYRFLNVYNGFAKKRLTMDEFLKTQSITCIKYVIKVKEGR